eukprot:Trichotokara_eunicae@DN849_c0_g1_i1.p1
MVDIGRGSVSFLQSDHGRFIELIRISMKLGFDILAFFEERGAVIGPLETTVIDSILLDLLERRRIDDIETLPRCYKGVYLRMCRRRREENVVDLLLNKLDPNSRKENETKEEVEDLNIDTSEGNRISSSIVESPSSPADGGGGENDGVTSDDERNVLATLETTAGRSVNTPAVGYVGGVVKRKPRLKMTRKTKTVLKLQEKSYFGGGDSTPQNEVGIMDDFSASDFLNQSDCREVEDTEVTIRISLNILAKCTKEGLLDSVKLPLSNALRVISPLCYLDETGEFLSKLILRENDKLIVKELEAIILP